MSTCIKDFFDYGLVEKRRVCEYISLKTNFNKKKTKKVGYISECRSCCKEYYYKNEDRLMNNIKIYNKENREKENIYEKK